MLEGWAHDGVRVCELLSHSPLCNPTDCNPPGSSVRGMSQERILEPEAIPFSGALPDPGIEPGFPISGGFFTVRARAAG